MKVTDPSSGKPYYYNTKTQQTQWECPPDFVDYDVSQDQEDIIDEQMRDVQRELKKQSTMNDKDGGYKVTASFSKKTGAMEGPGTSNYYENRCMPGDKEGRQLAYYFDLSQLDKPSQGKKRPKLPPGFESWDDFKQQYKEKKHAKRVKDILEDPY